MLVSRRSGARWLPVQIDNVEKWQACLLEESAERVGAALEREGRVHRWGFVGSRVTFRGQPAWLRVSPFLEHEMNWDAWRGTADASLITGMCKPSLLHRIEWRTEAPIPILVSAEVLTQATDRVASQERFLRVAPDLPEDWFRDLAESIAALHAHPTDRRFPVHDADEYGYLLAATYGTTVSPGTALVFGTEHLDLTWGNVTAPNFQIIDMEHWGVAVAGYGAAYLYLTALGTPAVADQVYRALADVLETPSGRYAQLVATAIILRNLTRLPDPGGLAARLHRHAHTLLT